MNSVAVIVGLPILAAGIALLFLMKRRRKLKGPSLTAIKSAWQRVLAQSNPVLKMVEADKVLDEALKLLGYTGSLGDKLRSAGPRFRNLNDIWAAHKLRNRLVHELNSQPNAGDVERALRIYERALRDLGLK